MRQLVSLRAIALAVMGAFVVLPAIGQHAGHEPAPNAPASQSGQAGPAKPATPGAAQQDHNAAAAPATAHDHPQQPAEQSANTPVDHSAHPMPGDEGPSAADLPVGGEPAPPPVTLGAADAIYGQTAMAAARGILADEHGGAVLWKLMLDQAEYKAGSGGAGYGWDAEAWLGGDINRLVVKTEGEGSARGGLEDAEWQALYSRAIGPYTDLQFGIRQDVGSAVATYATIGVETILPYWLKADAALFVSAHGAFARLEGTYDLLLTQRIVLQPNLEFNFALQNVPSALLGSGLTDITAGLRMRYDVTRNFSPYVGIEFVRKAGGTESLHRAAGERVEDTRLVLGVRTFF